MTSTKPLIIGIIGQRRAGKGTAAKYYAKKYNAQHHRFSEVLEDTLNRLYLEPTRDNLIKLGVTLRQTYGGEVLGKAIREDVLKSTAPFIVIEGFRFEEDIVMIEDLPNFHLICITADEKHQFERLKESEKPDEREMTWDEFQAISSRATEVHIDKLSKHAEKCIANDGTLEQFYEKLDQYLKGIGYEGTN